MAHSVLISQLVPIVLRQSQNRLLELQEGRTVREVSVDGLKFFHLVTAFVVEKVANVLRAFREVLTAQVFLNVVASRAAPPGNSHQR